MSTDNSLLNTVRTHIRLGNKAKARELIKEYVRQYPQDADGWYLAAQVSTNKTQAIACLEKAIKIDPFHEKAIAALNNLNSVAIAKPVQANSVNQKQMPIAVSPKINRQTKRLLIFASIILAPFTCIVGLALLAPILSPSSFKSVQNNEVALSSTEIIVPSTIITSTEFLAQIPTSTFTSTATFTPTLTPTKTPRPTNTPRPQPTDIPRGGKWTVLEDKSSFDDSKTVVIYLSAENSIKAWLDTPTPTLYLRCKENEIAAYINTDTQANTEFDDDYNNRPTARFRFDNAKAFELRMSESTDGERLCSSLIPDQLSIKCKYTTRYYSDLLHLMLHLLKHSLI